MGSNFWLALYRMSVAAAIGSGFLVHWLWAGPFSILAVVFAYLAFLTWEAR